MRKEIIEIQVKGTDNAIKQTDKLKKSVNEVKNETKEVGKSSNELGGTLDRMTGGAVSKFKGMMTSIKAVNGSFNMMKIAIIGTGIGALLIGILAVSKAFTNSEAGQNKFAKLMGVIGSVTGNLVDILASLGEKIIWVFENPKQAINDFVKLLKDNVINRFEGLLELIPQLGKAVKQLFTLDFSGAAETAANAVAKVALGTDNLTGSIKDASSALKDMAKEIADDAKIAADIADKRAKADKIDRDLIIERAQANRDIAELRLKSEQKDTYAVGERIKFLKEANAIEEETTNKSIKSATLRMDAIIAENKLSGSTKADLDAEANAKAKIIDLDAAKLRLNKRLATRIIEYQNEEKAGIKSILDAKQKALDEDFTQFEKRNNAIRKQIELDNKERERIAEQRILDNEALQTHLDEEEQIEIDAEDRRLAQLQITQEAEVKLKQDLANQEDLLREQKIQGAINVVDQLAGLAGQESDIGKALLLVKQAILARELILSIRSTINAAKETVTKTTLKSAEAGVDIAAGAGKTAAAAPFPANIPLILGYAATAIGIASSIKSALGVAKSASSSAGASGGGGQAKAPQFNIVGKSSTNQLAESIGSQEKKPIKTYVVSKEMSNTQELDRNTENLATFG